MLRITKGGKLLKNDWHYDEDTDHGEYRDTDVTDSAIRRLFDSCTIEEGVTLKDVLLLLDSEIELFDAVLGNWCKELVREGLDGPQKPYGAYHEDNIEYLELRYSPQYDPEEGVYGLNRLHFGGVGYELKEDHKDPNDYGMSMYKKGTRISWGICFTPVNDLVNIPVKISKEFTITDDNYRDTNTWGKKIVVLDNPETTLGQILEGIIWELSWHGSPEDRDSRSLQLKTIVDSIKEEI